ncbi:DUF4214 domain-containing protein [Flavitalea sp. BT771]|uniref:DUF4214 domain-containing protein n=1 Tax=Flavitalea sp. BT771 TaxID=3063329 RepID=UPI0026E3DA39|nr:DUF4214 domain-containing protein [Flavitalea sp. BT771]MDO6429454.1 DUF4214 domain-containing protein [Flavitalea sp. BT771]MDV6218418.1 DUF4214 domain-containing protein [Flavitalea sp. BT771]
MRPPITFILLVLLFASCAKTKFSDKNGTLLTASSLPRAATPGGVNVNDATSAKIWGVNGHPDNQSAYWANIDTQLDLIQEMGMTQYRVDMGTIRTGELTGANLTRFNELMTKCQQRGITVLPVVINNEWWASNYTRDDAYYVGALLGNGFASRYGANFHTYELGNEEEGYSLKYNLMPNGSKQYFAGEVVSDYDPALLEKTIYYLNGMIEGIRAVDPTAKMVINAGAHHYGFFQALQNSNVQYNIVGYHWYFEPLSAFQNILDHLANFHKDVWFTEFNRWYGSWGQDGLNQQSDYVYSYLNELETRPFVKGIFAYELFNQDEADSTQNSYGLIYWNTRYNYTAYTKKPVVATLKYEIEENKYGNEDFIYSMFLYCNDRVPDPGGLQYWTNRLTASPDRQAILNEALPQEAYGRWAEEQYKWLLDAPSMSTDLWNYWLGRMQSGTTREQMICEFCASGDFYTSSGSTTDGYVERLFNKLLGRPSDPTGKAYWVNVMNGGATRSQLANKFIHGQEYYNKFVDAQFHKLLRRTGPVEQSAIDYYTSKMTDVLNSWSQATVINSLLMSDEYWYRGINEGYVRRHPGYPLN